MAGGFTSRVNSRYYLRALDDMLGRLINRDNATGARRWGARLTARHCKSFCRVGTAHRGVGGRCPPYTLQNRCRAAIHAEGGAPQMRVIATRRLSLRRSQSTPGYASCRSRAPLRHRRRSCWAATTLLAAIASSIHVRDSRVRCAKQRVSNRIPAMG